jgi:hypothetical protein
MELCDEFHTTGPLPTWKDPPETNAHRQSQHGAKRKISESPGNQTLVTRSTGSHCTETQVSSKV